MDQEKDFIIDIMKAFNEVEDNGNKFEEYEKLSDVDKENAHKLAKAFLAKGWVKQ